jgi:hypothetical protein
LQARKCPGTQSYQIIEQLIFKGNDGSERYIPLIPQEKAKGLKCRIDSRKIEGRPFGIDCNYKNREHYQSLLQDIWGYLEIPWGDPGNHEDVITRWTFQVNDHYFRALAKIVFHYYLLRTNRVSGDEECFKPIRNFILNGGNYEEFVNTPRIFFPQSKEISTGWWHLLASSEKNGIAIGYVRLFIGPLHRMIDHHFELGRIPSKLILPERVWADGFYYDDPIPKTGRIGEVRPIVLEGVFQ